MYPLFRIRFVSFVGPGKLARDLLDATATAASLKLLELWDVCNGFSALMLADYTLPLATKIPTYPSKGQVTSFQYT